MDVSGISFSALSQVVNPVFFGNAVALIVLLLLAGLPLARRLECGFAAIILAILVGLGVTVLLAAAPWPFAKLQIAAVLACLAVLNLIPVKHRVLPDRPDGRLALWLVALLAATYLAANASPTAFMHYDYFHASMRSLELARSGTAFSPWFKQFDPSGWFLFDQTTSLTLDGLEVVWFGTQTGVLSKLVVLLLAGYLVLTLDRLRVAWPILLMMTAALCLYLVDSAFAFRPHIYVGLTLAVIAAQLAQPRVHSGKLLAVLLLFLVLAKRDGVILAPFVAMLGLWRIGELGKARRIDMRFAAPAAIAAIGLLVAGLSFAQIGGIAVGQQLLLSMAQLDVAQLLQRGVMAFLALCLALPAVSFALQQSPDMRRRLIAPLVLLTIVTVLIVASAVLLEGGSRFNEGTLLRKLVYFLLPPTLTFFALAFSDWRAQSRRWWGSAILFSGTAFVCLAAFLANQLQDVVNPRYGWGEIAIEAVAFFRSVVPTEAAVSIGFLVPQPDAIARSPFGETETYQFPMMTAYLGRDLKFAPAMSELSGRDIIFLPRAMPAGERLSIVRQSGRIYRELDGGYGLALTQTGLAAIGPAHVLTFGAHDPVDTPLAHVPWKFVAKSWPDQFRVAEVPWPADVTQVMAAWPADGTEMDQPLTLSFPNAERKRVFSVEFSDHPLGDRKPETIEITTQDGTFNAPAQSYFIHNRYVLPIRTQGSFSITFTAAQTPIEPPWMAPYFVLFDLQVLQEDQ
ncbi:hypothetical protein [Devosia sp. FKR38]|uniref:hypothetical protein n=1 Tax=Devosia sp. FKR38 TaxID=2562312 RepID=UPI0010C060E8|nr:hypothetical protein [Devosia sp. FKR38]